MTGSAGLTGKDPAGSGRRRFVCAGGGRETGSWPTIRLCRSPGRCVIRKPPVSVPGLFLDSLLPPHAVVDEDWVRHAVPPRSPVHLPDLGSRQRLGLAAEMRIGQDLGESPPWRMIVMRCTLITPDLQREPGCKHLAG